MAFYLSDIYTILLIYSISCFGLMIFTDKNRFILLLEYIRNQKYSVFYHRKDSLLFVFFTSLNTLILFSIAISFYLFSISKSLSIISFVKIFFTLFAFFIIKISATYFLGLIFEAKESAKKYYYTYATNLMFCNTFFLPIIIFTSYFQNGFIIEKLSFFISCLCGCIYLLAKLIMLNRLNLFSITSMFYNILYLCALEVLPYLVLFTVLELIN